MSIRGFYHTADGDEVGIDFNYPEEKRAFDSALETLGKFPPMIRNAVSAMAGLLGGAMEPGNTHGTAYSGVTMEVDEEGRVFMFYNAPKGEKPMFTTLQCEQINRRIDTVRGILDTHVFNLSSDRKRFNFCQYTVFKWEDGKWQARE